ncbi:metal-sensitive transcriptional regulator [Cellulomonas hominis]|uniref:Metal-sensitive transcriptional regulator n=1 Tax=Cellulomonas hominis TaxID=156981 RepID=A0A7Z8NRR2_9CELL|nr:metal-sensitive transcriptional regulator [Cellulomonas hominis]
MLGGLLPEGSRSGSRNTPGGYSVGRCDGVRSRLARRERDVHGYSGDKDDYLKRLKRIEGQVRGIARMVEEDVYCIDVLTQVSAVTKALQAVSIGLVEDHLGHCVVDAARQSPEAGAEKVREASEAIARLVRS